MSVPRKPKPRAELRGWASTQRQAPDGAIESEQRVALPHPVVAWDADGARALGRRYWREVEGSLLGLVRPRRAGPGLELRLLGLGPVLLRFDAPRVEASAVRVGCTYPIAGGALARRRGGEISFVQFDGGRLELSSAIRGFFPFLAGRTGRRSLGGTLYKHVQSRIHVAISRRYFAHLIAEASR
ncbi:MAG: hypothetical protein H0V84_06025 [Actinobacteria bacterium]|nr:hypothetical protein [Actinomycetota bacterium]